MIKRSLLFIIIIINLFRSFFIIRFFLGFLGVIILIIFPLGIVGKTGR